MAGGIGTGIASLWVVVPCDRRQRQPRRGVDVALLPVFSGRRLIPPRGRIYVVSPPCGTPSGAPPGSSTGRQILQNPRRMSAETLGSRHGSCPGCRQLPIPRVCTLRLPASFPRICSGLRTGLVMTGLGQKLQHHTLLHAKLPCRGVGRGVLLLQICRASATPGGAAPSLFRR